MHRVADSRSRRRGDRGNIVTRHFESIPVTRPSLEDIGPSSEDRIHVLHAFAFYAVFLAVSFIWSYTQNGRHFFFVYLGGANLLASAIWGVIGASIVIALSAGLTSLFSWAARLERQFAKHLTPLNVSEILIIALISGFAEEVFFRGTMQPAWGLTATTLLFSLAHFIPSRNWIAWFFLTIPIGFFLGILFLYTQNLWGCCLAHALINGVNLSLLNLKFQGKRSLIWNVRE